MMMLMRLYPKKDVDRLWNSVIAQLESYESKDIDPLYASQSAQDFVTLSLDAKDTDSIMEFLTGQICRIDDLADSHTIPLIKPAFLPLLRDTPRTMGRYTVEVKTHPENYHELCEFLLENRYGRDLVLAYIAYLFGEYDLILSLLATEPKHVEEFAGSLKRTKNVLEARITPIKRTLLLAKRADWDGFRARFRYWPSWVTPGIEKLYDFNLSLTEYRSSL